MISVGKEIKSKLTSLQCLLESEAGLWKRDLFERPNVSSVAGPLLGLFIVLTIVLATFSGYRDAKGTQEIPALLGLLSLLFLLLVVWFLTRPLETARPKNGPLGFVGELTSFPIRFLDTLLVRYFSRALAPVRSSGFGSTVGFVFASATIVGGAIFAPPPVAVISSAVGILGSIGVIRRWFWQQDDRSIFFQPGRDFTATFDLKRSDQEFKNEELEGFKIGFSENLSSHAMLCVPLIILFSAAALSYANTRLDAFEGQTEDYSSWLVFLGVELLKAIPIFDWSEIFAYENGSNIHPETVYAAVSLFLFRAAVDFAILGVIFRALGVQSFRRKQLSEYFVNRNVDVLDPESERAYLTQISGQFFEITAKCHEWGRFNRLPLYNLKRLSFILQSRAFSQSQKIGAAALLAHNADGDGGWDTIQLRNSGDISEDVRLFAYLAILAASSYDSFGPVNSSVTVSNFIDESLPGAERLPELSHWFESDSDWIRRQATIVTGNLKVKELTPHVREQLNDQNPEFRELAIMTLLELGAEVDRAKVEQLLDDDAGDVRSATTYYLGKMKLPFAAELLPRMIQDDKASVRSNAAGLLCEIDPMAGMNAIIELVQNNDVELQDQLFGFFAKWSLDTEQITLLKNRLSSFSRRELAIVSKILENESVGDDQKLELETAMKQAGHEP